MPIYLRVIIANNLSSTLILAICFTQAIVLGAHFPTELEPDDDTRKSFKGIRLYPFFAQVFGHEVAWRHTAKDEGKHHESYIPFVAFPRYASIPDNYAYKGNDVATRLATA